ncbi:hypothetical protein B0J11DRAFT_25917 [Dendryphion nanum]|uniref:Uncharacterized protein n=1 Tax=Dendryphion nanum TaxID=256645 RepID=A0A9P9EKL1_9PLEO|nr:hypothetical protein B0J11DRAFT_25917 [Dendryphion nanum]
MPRFHHEYYDSIPHSPRPLRLGLSPTETNLARQNAECYAQFSGLDQIPRIYQTLIQHTASFADSVKQLTRLPQSFQHAAALLVDFTINVLLGPNSCFHHMLNGQRAHIYWLLDEAMLHVCLDEWEKLDDTTSWLESIEPLVAKLVVGIAVSGHMADENYTALLQKDMPTILSVVREDCYSSNLWYFEKSRRFLEESVEMYGVRSKVNGCVQGRLPREIVDIVVDEVLIHEKGVPGSLRSRYMPKGKAAMK